MITPKMKRRIKREMSTERPTVWVGKEGVTRKLTDEVAQQLDKKETVKVRILKSALKEDQAEELASQIAKQTESTLIEVRGHTLLLHKPRENEE